jgi:tRNA pseudouridine32 synthase/23S rRNA pseudouridine746 synthase/23S rRNA pseudouridine1911/1915/1917 synthase
MGNKIFERSKMENKKHPSRKHLPRDLRILYEDDALLVIDKPAGLLTVATATNKTKTAHYILTDYIRKGSLKSRKQLFTVHRLDQWTSGVLIFAKSEQVKMQLQDGWKDIEKKYLAVVHGHLTPGEGVISSYLAENKAFVVYSTSDHAKGKLAQTAYKTLKQTRNFSLVEIDLLTGRKNQIRVQMAEKGHPVVGDRKYGKTDDRCARLALHAKSISFKHPVTGQPMTLEAAVPDFFKKLVRDI